MSQQSTRRKRKLPKRDVFELQNTSPNIEVIIPGSETFISPSEINSPNYSTVGRSNKYNSPITVGTPTFNDKSRSRYHVNKPLTRPSENFAERMQRVLSNGDCNETSYDDFIIHHSILPIFDNEDEFGDSKENSTLDRVVPQQYPQQPPLKSNQNNCDTMNEPTYRVIPRKVKSKNDNGHHDHSDNDNIVEDKRIKHPNDDNNNNIDTKICLPDEKKLVDLQVQVVIKQYTDENIPTPGKTLSRSQPLLSFTSVSGDEEEEDKKETEQRQLSQSQSQTQSQAQLLLIQQGQQESIQFQPSERIQKKLNQRNRSPKQISYILKQLQEEGYLEWS